MKKEDALSEEFLKQFKTGEELYSFLSQIQKRGVEQILEGELDAHLGYEKHQDSKGDNARNGHSKKKLRNQFGEAHIQVPRDRNSSFEPALVPKRKNMAEGVENIIISLYAKGMSVSDIEEQIRELYNIELSPSAISRITDRVAQDVTLWQNRPLESIYCIIWMDGIVFKVRENSRVVDKTIYIAIGLRTDGKKEVLAAAARACGWAKTSLLPSGSVS
jgi:putative transposase